MNKLIEMKRRQAEQAGELRAMLDKAEAEGRSLTQAEEELFTKLEKELAVRKAAIEREERLQVMESAVNAPAPLAAGRPAVDGNAAPAARSVVSDEVRCQVRQRDGQYKEGRAINPVKEFRTFAEQMEAVVRAGMGQGVDPRLVNLRAASGMSELVPSDGGFLVQQDFAAEILQRTYEMGAILSRVRRIPIGPNSNGLNMLAIDETSRATGSRWGGVQVYRTNESDALTNKKPKFRKMEMSLKKLTGLAYATDELLQDSTALESVLMQAFQEEFTFTIENEIVNGTGVGQMLGVMNSAALVTITKEGSQVATTFVAENAMKMWSRCWGRSRQNAVWYINQDVEPQLYQMNVKIKNVAGTENVGGMPVYLAAGTIAGQPYATLFGRPVIPVEYCATLGTKGDVLLFDPSQYVVIDKGGMQVAQSIHVRFLNDESTFRFTLRNDGQPIWNSALTPFKGTNTLSPFTVVETRS